MRLSRDFRADSCLSNLAANLIAVDGCQNDERTAAFSVSSRSFIFLVTVCSRPRLCENGALIIMQRSQYQGQMNEAFH